MKKKYVFLIASVIVSASIVFTGVYIGNSIKEVSKLEVENESVLLTEEEAADFLGISLEDFKLILSREKKQREDASFGTENVQHIPYVEISLENYFTRTGLSRWAEFNGLIRNRIR